MRYLIFINILLFFSSCSHFDNSKQNNTVSLETDKITKHHVKIAVLLPKNHTAQTILDTLLWRTQDNDNIISLEYKNIEHENKDTDKILKDFSFKDVDIILTMASEEQIQIIKKYSQDLPIFNYNPINFGKDEYNFSFSPIPNLKKLIEYSKKCDTKAYIIMPFNDYGAFIDKQIQDPFVIKKFYNTESLMFASSISKIIIQIKKNPHYVTILGQPFQIKRIIEHFKFLSGLHDEKINMLGIGDWKGIIEHMPPQQKIISSDINHKEIDNFNKEFSKIYNYEPDISGMATYDFINLLLQSLLKSPVTPDFRILKNYCKTHSNLKRKINLYMHKNQKIYILKNLQNCH